MGSEFTITRLNENGLEERLRLFEEHHAETFGTYLSSVEFYERFRAGEYDTPFGMAWATYFEAYARLATPASRPLVPA